MSSRSLPCWASLTLLCLAACGGGNSQSHIASAKAYLDKQNSKAAVIELKNALQKEPESGEARFLLGQALYEGGDSGAAVVEFRKALDFKHPEAVVLPALARAMNVAGQSRQLIEQYGKTVLADPKAAAEFKTSLSAAYAVAGNPAQARIEMAAALKVDPGNVDARLLQARDQAEQGNVDAAMKIVDATLETSPADAPTLVFKGDLLRLGKSDPDGALAAYRKALTLRPSYSAAHAAIISILLERKQLDAVATQIAELKKFWPSAPQIKWFEAQLAFQKGDLKSAARLAEQLLAVAPDNVRFLHFSASVGLLTGSVLQAENALSKAVQLAPDNPAIRRLLARAQLRLGQPAKALAAVQPLIDKGTTDSQSYSLAAQALLLSGDADKAQEYFAKAAKLNPADTVSRTALAMSRVAKGDENGAVSDLRDIAAADQGTAADLQLISLLARRKDFDGALKAIDRFEGKQPKSPIGPQLRGYVLLSQKDKAAARASFERAVKAEPTYFAAVASLASLDMEEKKPEQARQRFEKLLEADPKNVAATMALIDIRQRSGATDAQIIEMVNNAIKTDPTAVMPRLRLVDQLFKGNDVKSALAAAEAGVAAVPDNVQLLDALARAQWVAGQQTQAIASYNKLAALQPQSAVPHLRLAQIYLTAKNTDQARQSLKRVLAIDPASIQARREMMLLEVTAGNGKAALDHALALQKLRPKDITGYLFEGDLRVTEKNWPAATAAYRQAYASGKSGVAAVKLHTALLGAGKRAEADAFAAARLKEFPSDTGFISYLGDLDIGRKDYAAAESRFAAVVRIEPNSPAALNNLAWLMTEQQKKGGLPFAEKANALQPNQTPFVDTLAKVLAFEGQTDKAIALQKKLVDSSPDNTNLRLHLAKLYLQVGNKPLAKAELERLDALGDKLAANRDEVGRMLKAL